MYVWLFAFLFALVFGALGYGSGAIRTAVAFIGTLIALAVSGPLGRLLEPLTDKMTADNRVLQLGLPYFLAFVAVWFVIYGMGFAAHRPVCHHFKYREDDATREGFERVNQAGGLVIGMFIALILFFTVGKRVYAGGYLAAQTIGEGASEPVLVKLATAVRRQMESSGWDKTFAALDHTPARFYEVSDMLGLLYENPVAVERLHDYPPYFELEDKPEFAEMGADAEFKKLLTDKAGFSAVLNHPHTRTLLANNELTEMLLQTDLKDLEAYLRTGVSPQYANERILGRWKVDVNSALLQTRRMRGTISPTEFAAMRAGFNLALKPVRMKVFTDGRFVISSTVAKPADGTEVQPDPAAAPSIANDPRLSARYGLSRPGGANVAAAAGVTVRTNQAGGLVKIDVTGEGRWKRVDGKYVLTSPKMSGGVPLEGTINDLGRLVIPVPNLKMALVLVPAG